MELGIYLIPTLIVGGLITLAVFGILATIISMRNYKETPARDRLMLLKGRDDYLPSSAQIDKGPFEDLKEVLLTYSAPIAKSLYGTNQKYLQQVKMRLTEAGKPDTETHVWQFLAQRVATGITAGVLLGVPSFVLTGGQLILALMIGLTGATVGLLGPEFALRMEAGKRKEEIRFKLPDTLDLMIVCVEAGLSMDATLQRVAEETDEMAPEISHEFKRLNKEIAAGITRSEAFQNLGQRVGVDELRSLCAMVVQSDKLGTSIADTLRIFAEDLRTKRRQRAEELASKASIKMTFPLVLFIFPPLFIVLMGPTVIMAIQTFME